MYPRIARNRTRCTSRLLDHRGKESRGVFCSSREPSSSGRRYACQSGKEASSYTPGRQYFIHHWWCSRSWGTWSPRKPRNIRRTAETKACHQARFEYLRLFSHDIASPLYSLGTLVWWRESTLPHKSCRFVRCERCQGSQPNPLGDAQYRAMGRQWPSKSVLSVDSRYRSVLQRIFTTACGRGTGRKGPS